MIEKIDRPEAPPPYSVREAKQTKEDRHQQREPREDAEREQKKQLEEKEWEKFGRRDTTIKPLRVARDKISRCLYRAVTLHSGIGTLMVDVSWVDGRWTRGALMLVTRLEDFIRLKKLAPGQEVPLDLWARGPMVEMGIVQRTADSGKFPGRDLASKKEAPEQKEAKPTLLQKIGIKDKAGKTHWELALLYAFLVAMVVMAAIFILV
ncbi:MAG: hypothetical protein ABH871_10395 [Pseudomonadota bacterium]